MLMPSPRKLLRDSLFKFLRRLCETDDARAIAARTFRGLLQPRPDLSTPGCSEVVGELPYSDLARPALAGNRSVGDGVVFITARFRSGSTLLWNIFRSLEGFTAYYEPLNERKWFDPASRGSHTDPTHRNVDDYWREYEGLEELKQWYRLEWIDRNLFMDAAFWDPDLRRYIEILVERARGRPVLQFNRVDFRLPWLRKNFPEAKLVHLYRHPRDQWCSTLVDPRACPYNMGLRDFEAHDHYYLRVWASDLKYQFPFLEEGLIQHPYRMFYCIWRLSYDFGKKYGQFSLAFEDIVQEPRNTLGALCRFLEIDRVDWRRIEGLLVKPEIGKWRSYADDFWFREHEEACELLLHDFRASVNL